MITIEPYSASARDEWDAAVAAARNATFLHRRGYMDYHADRFADCSLIARDSRRRVAGLLPACRTGATLSSHAGLTYGGWLLPDRTDTNAMMEIWTVAADHMASTGIDTCIIKPVPHIYHRYPAEEELYALYRAGAVLRGRQVSATVDLTCPLPFRKDLRHKLALATRAGMTCRQSDRWADFWPLLTAVLHERHDATPVHSLDEITRLHAAFPDNILLWAAESPAGDLLAGTVLYITDTCVHSQYIAAGTEGRAQGAVGALYGAIIAEYAGGQRRWLDFGVSCEAGGAILNHGLAEQKASFGARATVYDCYEVRL